MPTLGQVLFYEVAIIIILLLQIKKPKFRDIIWITRGTEYVAVTRSLAF